MQPQVRIRSCFFYSTVSCNFYGPLWWWRKTYLSLLVKSFMHFFFIFSWKRNCILKTTCFCFVVVVGEGQFYDTWTQIFPTDTIICLRIVSSLFYKHCVRMFEINTFKCNSWKRDLSFTKLESSLADGRDRLCETSISWLFINATCVASIDLKMM